MASAPAAMTADPAEQLRPAATVILVRRTGGAASVLMGMRGAGAVFMPSKYVFPGGALDGADALAGLSHRLGPASRARLAQGAEAGLGPALAAAAIRELWEEAGLVLGEPAPWPDPPPGWEGFAATGHRPSAAGLRFFFRAITPPGRPRRFDARFFVADAARLAGSPDDFSRASDELSHLHWLPVADAQRLDLPFITEVVLAELAAYLDGLAPDAGLPAPEAVPFFDNSGPEPTFRRLV
jgi:8-oxo-dGTP pyrophosphatase MutT (NUDIX family)